MNIVDMSYGTRRTVLTKTLVTQLMDICGDMWRVITRANSSHIVGKLVTMGQGINRKVKKLWPIKVLATRSLGLWFLRGRCFKDFTAYCLIAKKKNTLVRIRPQTDQRLDESTKQHLRGQSDYNCYF